MLRNLFLLCLAFFCHTADAKDPNWLYKRGIAGQDTMAVIVGVEFYRAFELNGIRTDVDTRAKAMAQELAEWEDVGNIALILSKDASKASVTQIVAGMPKAKRVIFVWIGLGIGRDSSDPRILASDVQGENYAETSFTPYELKQLLMNRAGQVDVVLDVTVKGQYMGLSLMGPDASNFETESCASCTFVTSAMERNMPPSENFINEYVAILREHREAGQSLSYAKLHVTLTQLGWTPSVLYQGGVNQDDFLLEKPAPPLVVETPNPVVATTPLPVDPIVKPKRKLKPVTMVLGGATVAFAAASVVSGVLLNETMTSMENAEAIRKNYPDDEALQSAADMRGVYGVTMVSTAVVATGSAVAAGVTLAF